MLNMPFWNGHNLWNPPRPTLNYVSIDSEWSKIIFYISPQLQQTPALFPKKNPETGNNPSLSSKFEFPTYGFLTEELENLNSPPSQDYDLLTKLISIQLGETLRA